MNRIVLLLLLVGSINTAVAQRATKIEKIGEDKWVATIPIAPKGQNGPYIPNFKVTIDLSTFNSRDDSSGADAVGVGLRFATGGVVKYRYQGVDYVDDSSMKLEVGVCTGFYEFNYRITVANAGSISSSSKDYAKIPIGKKLVSKEVETLRKKLAITSFEITDYELVQSDLDYIGRRVDAKKKEKADQDKKEKEELAAKEETEKKDKEEQNDKKEEQSNKSANENKSELTSTQQASVTSAVNGTMAEASGDYTSALNHYRSARNMGNYNVSETKIRQMEFMSGVQQIGGVINYWAENARKQKEMRAAAERRAVEAEAEAEANYRQRMQERDRLHLPVTDYETFTALKEATDKDLVPFIGSDFENDPKLKAEFEKVRESLTYFYATDNVRLEETKGNAGETRMPIIGHEHLFNEGFALLFSEARREEGKGKFILMSNESHSMNLKKPPFSADIIPNMRILNGFYNDNIQGYVYLGSGIKKSEIKNALSNTRTDLVDFGLQTILGEYTIAINILNQKFHILFDKFNIVRARYELTWDAHSFTESNNNYLFSTTISKRKFNILHNFEEKQTGFFISQDPVKSITTEIDLYYLPVTTKIKDGYSGKYEPSYNMGVTTLKKTKNKSTDYKYFDFNGMVTTGNQYMPYPWVFYKK